jgi:hypothetical protein
VNSTNQQETETKKCEALERIVADRDDRVFELENENYRFEERLKLIDKLR